MSKPFNKVYQFKVTLKGIRPPIWRRIQVPGNYSFWDLHVAIQDAMGWFDLHLHVFEMINPKTGFKEEIGIPDDDFGAFDHKVIPGWKRRISRYFSPENPKAIYSYDFGDDWEHEIKLEKILTPETDITFPRCIKGKGACPPEDCGGVWGYYEMLETLSDPEHEDYENTVEWLGEFFDPEYFDISEIEFEDPQVRWNMAFTEDWEPDDVDLVADLKAADDYIDDEEEPENILKSISRRHMFEIWEKAKGRNFDGLSEEEARLAQVMLDHEEEFFNDFEFSDVTHERTYDPDTDINPFLHITLHTIVENQLDEKDPVEVFQFYNAMRKKKYSRHDTIHLIGMILAPLLFGVLQEHMPFDLDTYKALLKKYKTRNPEKIPDLLEKEPGLFSDDE